jgi:FkbM family methyltransferase
MGVAMHNIKKTFLNLIPEWCINIIRPVYAKLINIIKRLRSKQLYNLDINIFDGFEVAYRHGTTDEQIIAHSFDRDIFFSGTPEYKPGDDHVVIDVGAHIGTFSLLASSKVPRGKVYAIEACEDSFNFLRINVALNKASNVSVYHLALSDQGGKCKLYHDTGNWGHTTVKSLSRHSETVDCCTLTKFMDMNSINECHFIKLNCERAEFPILLSTQRDVLLRFETILVLYHCDLWGRNTETDLLSHLYYSGFKSILRNQSENRGWIIATRNN